MSMQIKDRTFRRIIRENPSNENGSDETGSLSKLAGAVTSSSLLGRDPCGDEELPARPTSREGDEAEASETAPEYTETQALLKSVQDKT